MKLSPRILSVSHVQITVPPDAEDAARDFYCATLGIPEISKPEALAGRGGFWLEVGAFQVHVGIEELASRADTKAHVAYEVDDLDEWRAKLKDAGIAALDGVPIPHYRRFEFRDPFGNRVEFLERM